MGTGDFSNPRYYKSFYIRMSIVVKNKVKRFKHLARRRFGQTDLARRLLKDTLSIFLYHEVSDKPSRFCERYNLNVPPGLFARQMDFIAEHFNIINPDDLLLGHYDTPAALIAFDDGMPGYFREAVPIMVSKQIPSIIFLNMAPVEGEIFWSGLITYLTEYDAQFREVLRNHFPRQKNVQNFLLCNSKIVNNYIATIDFNSLEVKARSFYGPFASLKDLDSVRDNPLVFFGNHLYNHYNALQLNDEELRQQYLLNDQKMAGYSNRRPFFSYPFGQPEVCFTLRQTELLHSFGAKAVFSSSGRINRRGQDGFYDRIGVDSSIETAEDLLGLIQWMRFKTALKGTASKK